MAFFPPSSIEYSMSRPAACAATMRPTRVLPVNIRKSQCSMSGPPSSGPEPVTTCSTPGGRPASASSSAAHSAEYGVCPSGLAMTALPAASAGRASLMPSVSG